MNEQNDDRINHSNEYDEIESNEYDEIETKEKWGEQNGKNTRKKEYK